MRHKLIQSKNEIVRISLFYSIYNLKFYVDVQKTSQCITTNGYEFFNFFIIVVVTCRLRALTPHNTLNQIGGSGHRREPSHYAVIDGVTYVRRWPLIVRTYITYYVET